MAGLGRSTLLGGRASETFGSFRTRDFSLVWVSANIAMAGRQMEVIAVLWLVLELTGDPLLVGWPVAPRWVWRSSPCSPARWWTGCLVGC